MLVYQPYELKYNSNSLLYTKYTNYFYVGKNIVVKVIRYFISLIDKSFNTLVSVLDLLKLIYELGPNSPPRIA